MAYDGQVVTVPFPSGLMSTARSALVMPAQFGVEVRNLLLAADGAGTKRNGFAPLGPSFAGLTVTGVFGFMHGGASQVLVSLNDGSLRLLQEGEWTPVWTGMNPAGVVRAVTFGGRLVFCNGVDPLLAWDGAAMAEIAEYVNDASAALTYVDAETFTIESEEALYPIGRKVRARLGVGSYAESTVASVSQLGDLTTVVLADGVLTGALDEVAYEMKPPAFALLYAAHDRLWGMGQGPVSRHFSAHVDRSRVYYTHGFNNPAAWHDALGAVPQINLADKAGLTDELVAMAVQDGLTVFFGRRSTQVWQGTNPAVGGDFAWQKTLPVGVPHAGLVVEMPNDVMFVNAGGARTLSRALQTGQLEISDVGSEVDPTLQLLVTRALEDEGSFGKIRHGCCETQGWYGLTLPGVMAVFQITSRGTGWVLFDGLPAVADALGNLPDGRLCLAAGGQLYTYDERRWDDDGVPISWRWLTPWLSGKKGRRWANHHVEVMTSAGPLTELTLKRYRNHDFYNPAQMTVVANRAADFWESAHWDEAEWDNGVPQPARVRDHHVAGEMAYAVENTSGVGPLTVFGLKLYGVGER